MARFRTRILQVATAAVVAAGAVAAVGLTSAAPQAAAAEGCTYHTPSYGSKPQVLRTTSLFGRRIDLYNHMQNYKESDGIWIPFDMCGWAQISNGDPGDEVWIDRSYDGGRTWEPRLGYVRIPGHHERWRTAGFQYFGRLGPAAQMRACGKAGNRREIVCTGWV